MLRASASSSATVCSAAEMMLDCGRVADDHAGLGRRLDVDVVEPDTGTGHHLQLGGRGDDVRVDGGLGADHDALVVTRDRDELVLAEPGADVDVVLGGQGGDARLGQLVGDQDPHGMTPGVGVRGEGGWGAFPSRSLRRVWSAAVGPDGPPHGHRPVPATWTAALGSPRSTSTSGGSWLIRVGVARAT
jgi:hypothetical protein